MRKNRQLLLTILITIALIGLAWFAGQSRFSVKMRSVVMVRNDIPAGSQIAMDQLALVEIPENAAAECFLTDLSEAAGQWTAVDLQAGEIISRKRLTVSASGLQYPDPAPGRRLLTLNLNPADANGYWLAAGNRVDLYLVPRNRENIADIQVMENIRIMSVISGGSEEKGGIRSNLSSDCLICLDLNCDQARLLSSAPGIYDIRLSAINEPQAAASE